MASHAIQRVLGIKRPAWAKVLPVVAIAIAYIPAIVFVGIVALTPDDPTVQQHIPTYGQYYAYIISAIALFVAIVAPEVLCPDRRTGMLGLYLASPLSPRHLPRRARPSPSPRSSPPCRSARRSS